MSKAVLQLAAKSKAPLTDLVTQWCNASEVSIDAGGDIWVAVPQSGHWLSDERKTDFVAWCQSR